MNISAKTEYACIAVLELAARYDQGKPVRIREIVEANGIPSTRISDDAGGMMPWLHSLHPIRLMVRQADVEIAVSLLDGNTPDETSQD